jgi:2-methylisocitrate lyase-like PEP mutase family enzyme
MLTGGVTAILLVKELEQLGYKIVVCPIESLMVCARAMRDLCEAWKNTGRVDNGYAGDEFCRGEEVARRGGVLKAPGKALRAS